MKASRVMTVHVTCISPETPLRQAQQLIPVSQLAALPFSFQLRVADEVMAPAA
jgi:hypothetical protein